MPRNLRITVEGKAYLVKVEYLDESGVAPTTPLPTAPVATTPVAVAAAPAPAPLRPAPLPAPEAPSEGRGDISSPIAGVVSSVDVNVGDQVASGQQLLAIEAMKMNTYIWAPQAGRVAEIRVSKGSAIRAGDTLVRIA